MARKFDSHKTWFVALRALASAFEVEEQKLGAAGAAVAESEEEEVV